MSALLACEQASETRLGESRRIVYKIDPLKDSRWDALLENHPDASAFHTRAWLEALFKTYGYKSFAYTTSAPGEPLRDGLVFCRVEDWFTGRRLVSLPFSDHCEPLIRHPGEMQTFINSIQEEFATCDWRYIEIRPKKGLRNRTLSCQPSTTYAFYRLNLKPELNVLFCNFHKSSIQRKIKRARREGLRCETGATESLLNAFYALLTITRRRHGVPPQPKVWFRNLIECFGPALQISVAYKQKTPVAAMLTLHHKNTLVYKYGGSDPKYNNLGSMHCLYWEAIQRAKVLGLEEFDLGRTDIDQPGLMTFKRRWGAAESSLSYFRISHCERPTHMFEARTAWKARAAKTIFSVAPAWVLSRLGGLLYKHIG